MGEDPEREPWLQVEVDAGYRYVRTAVHRLDDDGREVDALVAAFDRAYARAIETSASARPVTDRTAGGRVATARGHVSRMPTRRDTPGRVPRWDLINAGSSGVGVPDTPGVPAAVTGQSDNTCVTVRLDPASSRGRLVDVDQGWLRQTSAARLAAAIDESFVDAYRKGDI